MINLCMLRISIYFAYLLTLCYETIMFGRVTHMLDAAAMQGRSLFTLFTFCNTTVSCSLIPKENTKNNA